MEGTSSSVAASAAAPNQNDLLPLWIYQGRKYKIPLKCRRFVTTSEGIYASLIGISSPETEIKKWMHAYKINPIRAVQRLLEFFLHASGYLESNITLFIAKNEVKFTSLFNNLGRTIPDLVKKNQYLFKSSPHAWSLRIQTKITDFVSGLFDAFYVSDLLQDRRVTYNVVVFIQMMSKSNINSLRHTGVVFALKLAESIERMRVDIVRRGDHGIRSVVYNCIFQRIFFILTDIFKNNLSVKDTRLWEVRFTCILHMEKMFKANPNFFFSEEYFNSLLDSCSDAKSKVRLIALQAIVSLGRLPKFEEYVERNPSKVFDILGKRLTDCTSKVIIAAIKAFIRFIYQNPP